MDIGSPASTWFSLMAHTKSQNFSSEDFISLNVRSMHLK